MQDGRRAGLKLIDLNLLIFGFIVRLKGEIICKSRRNFLGRPDGWQPVAARL